MEHGITFPYKQRKRWHHITIMPPFSSKINNYSVSREIRTLPFIEFPLYKTIRKWYHYFLSQNYQSLMDKPYIVSAPHFPFGYF